MAYMYAEEYILLPRSSFESAYIVVLSLCMCILSYFFWTRNLTITAPDLLIID
jgi:hypothetical protein